MKKLDVVCAILLDADRVLLAQKGPESKSPLLWEFPGGKVEPNESPTEALKREIREELGCEISILDPQPFCRQNEAHLQLTAYLARVEKGTPEALEHQDVRWFSVTEVVPQTLVPADRPIFQELLTKHS